MDDPNSIQANSDSGIVNKSVEEALKEGDHMRISANQITQRNTDSRSGNHVVRDATDTRIIIGLLPDGTYGLVVSKEGYDVYGLYT